MVKGTLPGIITPITFIMAQEDIRAYYKKKFFVMWDNIQEYTEEINLFTLNNGKSWKFWKNNRISPII